MSVTAYKTPGTCASVPNAGTAWSNPNNAKTSDDAYASCPLPKLGNKEAISDWLRATNFGFDGVGGVPAGATINGFDVKIEHKASAVSVITDFYLFLRKTSGQVGSSKASASYWPTSDAEVTYTWAAGEFGGLTAAEIRDSGFGVDLAALNGDSINTQTAYVDCISIRVYYTEVVPFKNYYPHILAH